MSTLEMCRVVEHQQITPHHFKLTLQSDHISSTGQPGQFVNIRVSPETDPFLRRPFGIHRTNKEQGTFDILYEVFGQGTELLAKYQVGQSVDVLGPLGKGFVIEQEKKISIIVAGGIGVAPMLELGGKIAENLACRQAGQKSGKADIRIIALIGANTKTKVLCEKEFKDLHAEVFVTTDDGSYGKKGFVSESLEDLLETRLSAIDYRLSAIYSCGPHQMLQAVAQIAAQKNLPCQVSVEQKMACGFGTCMGCVIQTKDGYKRVCKEGPVFDSRDISW